MRLSFIIQNWLLYNCSHLLSDIHTHPPLRALRRGAHQFTVVQDITITIIIMITEEEVLQPEVEVGDPSTQTLHRPLKTLSAGTRDISGTLRFHYRQRKPPFSSAFDDMSVHSAFPYHIKSFSVFKETQRRHITCIFINRRTISHECDRLLGKGLQKQLQVHTSSVKTWN